MPKPQVQPIHQVHQALQLEQIPHHKHGSKPQLQKEVMQLVELMVTVSQILMSKLETLNLKLDQHQFLVSTDQSRTEKSPEELQMSAQLQDLSLVKERAPQMQTPLVV